MSIRPTRPPRTRALVRQRVSLTALGAGGVAAGLVLACAEPRPQPIPPQPNCMGIHAGPCLPEDLPPPRPKPPPPPPPPPQRAAQPTASNGVDCKAVSGTMTVELQFDFESMKGTLSIDGPETRRFDVEARPHAATYSLVFSGRYGTGDVKPAAEKLTAGKSVVARLVASGDDEDLYFDADVHPAGMPVPLRCRR